MSNVCQQCVKTSDVPVCYWCLDCNKAVCECCKENYVQSHQFEKISSPLILMKIPNCCGNHHDKEFQCFCKDHYSLCCIDCLIQDHRGCLNIEYIVDAIKGFKSYIVFNKYKKYLKTISKSFGNLKNILETGKNDVQVRKYSHQSKIESKFHRFVKISEQESFKEKFLEKVKNDKNTCLLELQKQISIVSKCETDIKTIETSFERIWEQLSEEKLFLMVHLSMKFLESTLKKAISDSESINLEITSMRVGETNCEYEIFGTRQKVLPQNLLALLVKQELADYGTRLSLPQFY